MSGAFAIGGCAYRNQVHTRHLSSVLELMQGSRARVAGSGTPFFSVVSYFHTSNLPRGRCEWLRPLIANRELEWAVSVDSDTEFSAVELLIRMQLIHGDRAIGVAPVVIGGTGDSPQLNVNNGQGRLRVADLQYVDFPQRGVAAIQSGGFGLAVFNLRWFRQHWSLVTPELVGWERSEDIALCESVVRRGGSCAAIAVSTVHHEMVARPGQQISYVDGGMVIL